MKLLLVGGSQRPVTVGDRDHEHLYDAGILAALDPADGALDQRLRYVSEGWPHPRHGQVFKGISRSGDHLVIATEREVLDVAASGDVLGRFSHPLFNDVHHAIRHESRLYVASSGLDGVVITGGDRDHFEGISDPEERDYRSVSTKPHAWHPNHVFAFDGRVWMTRCHPGDAVALGEPARTMDLGPERVHDGLVQGDRVWFTRVDGHLVQSDGHRITRTIDLNRVVGLAEPLGWCRGLHIVGTTAYVGFTRLRATRFVDRLSWVKGMLAGRQWRSRLPTRVAAFDLEAERLLHEWVVEPVGLHAVFGIESDSEG